MQAEKPKKPHLTQRDLADRWCKSEATIERYRSDGVGPQYLKIGGKVLYRHEDIERFELECLYVNPQSRISGDAAGAVHA